MEDIRSRLRSPQDQREMHAPPPLALFADNLARAGFRHGFSTRAGGASEAPFATLNFGAGDDPARVAENVRRLANATGFIPGRFAR